MHKFAAETPTCTMRGLAGDADKFEGLVVDLALARVLDHHLLGPGQNADACGCLAASALNVKSIPVLVK